MSRIKQILNKFRTKKPSINSDANQMLIKEIEEVTKPVTKPIKKIVKHPCLSSTQSNMKIADSDESRSRSTKIKRAMKRT